MTAIDLAGMTGIDPAVWDAALNAPKKIQPVAITTRNTLRVPTFRSRRMLQKTTRFDRETRRQF
jgi:hypothetical protein